MTVTAPCTPWVVGLRIGSTIPAEGRRKLRAAAERDQPGERGK